MHDLEKMKAEQAAAIAKAEQENTIAAAAPIPPKRAMIVAGLGERAWLTYECASLFDAIDIMRAYGAAILPMFEYRGTFCRFEPECVPHKGEQASGPYIAQIRVNQGEGFGPSAELAFFARLAGDVVKIRCDMGARQAWQYGAQFAAVSNGRGRRLDGNRYIRGEWRQNSKLSAFADKVTKWAGGTDTTADFSYAIIADDESGEWIDAGLRLENLAAALHGERP